MKAQRGKDLLLKLSEENDPSIFNSVAGLRTRNLSLNAQSVDITHAQSTGGWRELLMGAGIKQAAISGSGVFLNEETASQIRHLFFNGEIRSWQILLPGFGVIEGAFQIVNLDYAGEFDGEVTMSMALESAGALSFVPEVGA